MAREAIVRGKAWQSVSWLVLGEATKEATHRQSGAEFLRQTLGRPPFGEETPGCLASHLRARASSLTHRGRVQVWVPSFETIENLRLASRLGSARIEEQPHGKYH